jgi:ion channel-forming bestrophin family protein
MIQYDPHQWSKHLLDVRGSMVREIGSRVLLVGLVAVVVALLHRFVRPMGFSDRPHALIGVALGLLLVFRTNAAYDRFWEGRKLWGGIVNASRNLVRSALAHVPAHEPALASSLLEWAVAMPWAIMHSLRGQRALGPACGLPAAEREQALASQHVPLHVATRLTGLLRELRARGHVEPNLFVSLDGQVATLVDLTGGCERIHGTPLPFAYVVHLRRALVLYCATLPFALVDAFGSWSVLVTVVLSYVILGIEEIGVEIEDPFGGDDNDLPLQSICQRIEANLRALGPAPAADTAPPPSQNPGGA